MNPLTRVLTAVDLSEPARAAFDHALVLSRTHNAELTVLHAVPGERSFEWHAHKRGAMVAALREGLPVTQVMGKNYETMLKR